MSDYAAKIAQLEAAAASGELTIEANGERVTYRSMSDLLGALSYFRRQASAGSASGGSTSTLAAYDPE